ncbi:MAG: flagellar motor protein MotB [Actinobacteria bacterium]|nr:flagellar motor protein MotB [Actinomycetota bacterium]
MTRSRRGRGRGHGAGGGGGGGHGGGDARWLVTYADLLTLLMVLFLVLWVISTIDLQKFENFKDGLGDFGNPAAKAVDTIPGDVIDNTPETGDSLPATRPEYLSTTTTTTTIAAETPGGNPDGGGALLTADELAALQQDLIDTITAAGLSDVVTVELEQRGLVVSLVTDDVLFAPASGHLEPAANEIINLIAAALTEISNPIIVEGYTDKRPINRVNYDNWDLSVDRAVSVVKLLRDNFGVEPSRLAATGYGDQHPLATGDNEAAYKQNRRVQIVVVAGTVDVQTATATATG